MITMAINKGRITNKERARRARQRKKQYYDDLERRAEYLEKKVQQLTKELEFTKQKNLIIEGKVESKEKEEAIGNCLMEDIINLVNAAEGEHILQEWNKFQINYGPYGPEKIKIMDFAFKSIIENMLWGMTKLTLYSIEKKRYLWLRLNLKDMQKWRSFKDMKNIQIL